MLFEVLCYRNRTRAASGRLLSQVPRLEPPIGFCSLADRGSPSWPAPGKSTVIRKDRRRREN
jgi:hypothetical protein